MGGFIKGRRHWVVPTALAAVLVSALFISPAIGGPKFITGKKVNKTIVKKTNATELRVQGTKEGGNTFDLNQADSLMASLPLTRGNYIVTTTFSLVRDTSGLIVQCELRAGNRKDDADAFGGGSQLQDNVAMSVTSFVPQGGRASLHCGDGSPGTASRLTSIEITALKVPKITNQTAP
jgi:hypothetical protein